MQCQLTLNGVSMNPNLVILNWHHLVNIFHLKNILITTLYINSTGRYDFSGDLDILEFLRIAQEEDLYVLLRPGPYICAERDMGGLPFWLLKNGSDIYLRSSDSRYIEHAERWIVGLLQKVEPFLYGNGGPIILVQVENEYGSYKSCDQEYTSFLRDTFKRIVKDKAVLYTTDGGTTYFLQCGKISGDWSMNFFWFGKSRKCQII